MERHLSQNDLEGLCLEVTDDHHHDCFIFSSFEGHRHIDLRIFVLAPFTIWMSVLIQVHNMTTGGRPVYFN
jgi:hypothetical protein